MSEPYALYCRVLDGQGISIDHPGQGKYPLTELHVSEERRHEGRLKTIASKTYQIMEGFEIALQFAAYGRAFCRFDDGHVGWVPEKAEVEDQFETFLGAQVPIMLRPREDVV